MAGPIVIGGAPRSGTTLVLSLLSSDPALAAVPFETYALADVPPRVERLRAQLGPMWEERWVEKTPANVRYIPSILEALPGSLFVHVVRDGRDVCVSRHPGDSHYTLSVGEWVQDVTAGLEHESDPRVLTLRYEDLVLDFREQVGVLCAFLGLDARAELLAYPAHAALRVAHAWEHPAIEVHGGAIGRWRLPEHAGRVAEFYENGEAVDLCHRLYPVADFLG